jgi:hypothetical protein
VTVRIIHSGQVENAVRETLQTWLHTFLNDAERTAGLTPGHVERPHMWVRTTDALSIPVRKLPTVAIISDGWEQDPSWEEDGGSVWWAVEVSIFAKGVNRDDALDNARLLTAAARQTLESKRSLGDFADDLRLLDEETELLDASRERTLAGGSVVCSVLVPRTISRDPGPAVPDPPDEAPAHPDAPTAETVEITTSHIDEMP